MSPAARRPLITYLVMLAAVLAVGGVLVGTSTLQTRSLAIQTHDAVAQINAVLIRLTKDEARITEIANRNSNKVESTTQRTVDNSAQLAELRALITETRLTTTTQIAQVARAPGTGDLTAILAAILVRLDQIDARLAAIERQGAPSSTASPGPKPTPTPRRERPGGSPGPLPSPSSGRCVVDPVFLCASANP